MKYNDSEFFNTLKILHLKPETLCHCHFHFSTDLFFFFSLGQGAEATSELSVGNMMAGLGQGGVAGQIWNWRTISQLIDVGQIEAEVWVQLNHFVACVIPNQRQRIGIPLEAGGHQPLSQSWRPSRSSGSQAGLSQGPRSIDEDGAGVVVMPG
jgi:hypothetical protein